MGGEMEGYSSSVALPDARDAKTQPNTESAFSISQRDAKWLLFASYGTSGMYQGDYWDNAPVVYAKLERLGLVRLYEPHNRVHKARAVATERGRALLKALSAATAGPSAATDRTS